MYTIYLDDECLYYPGDTVNTLNKAVIKEGVGDAGSIDLNVPPTNPLVEKIKERQSMITVYKDDKEKLKVWGENARKLSVEVYDKDILSAQVVDVLEKIYKSNK